jgi:signal transduction histidine kinase
MSTTPLPFAHEVRFYDDDVFLADGVASFINNGLQRGHAAIIIATLPHQQAIRARLAHLGAMIDPLIAEGHLIFADARETLGRFMIDGLPDPGRFEASVGRTVHDLLASHPALCAYGEMVDLLSASGNHTGTLALEELWNRLLTGLPAHLLCGYRLDRFDRATHRDCFHHICQAHTHVLPTEDFTRIDELEAQRRAIAELQQRALALTAEVEERRKTETALNHKSEALERSNAELLRFTYIAAHDLQEPLRMVSQYLGLVQQRGGSLPEEITSYIGHALHGAGRMRALIDALLVYGSVGYGETIRAPVDTNSLVSDVGISLRSALVGSGAQLSYLDLPFIMADAARLSQVFEQLVANALKYRSSEQPKISISAVHQGQAWIFSVRDNGLGIEAVHHQTIFEVFQRLHRQEAIPGTGIGLAICKRIVERHGGRIWVESSPGHGSTFRFSIPD